MSDTDKVQFIQQNNRLYNIDFDYFQNTSISLQKNYIEKEKQLRKLKIELLKDEVDYKRMLMSLEKIKDDLNEKLKEKMKLPNGE